MVEENQSKTLIDKLAFIYIKDKKVLVTLTIGKDRWYIPGGKREVGETDEQALIREVKEEIDVDILPETISFFGTFRAQAHGKSDGVIVQMKCYFAEFRGNLKPSNEIEKIDFFEYSQKNITSTVDGIIFDELKRKNLIN